MIRVGCCGWPVGQRQYAAVFDLVEVQQSFYNLPRLATAERWRRETPPGFEFVLKAPQLITHDPSSPDLSEAARAAHRGAEDPLRVVPTDAGGPAAWTETLALARALGSRLVLFQCPASFTPTAEHLRDFTGFFETLERDGLQFVWEPRGQWPDAEVTALCRRLGLIHAVDPFQRPSVWGEPVYYRLHGKGGVRSSYSDADLAELKTRVGPAPAYVLFNNTAMWDDACRFGRLLSQPDRRPGRR